MIQTENGSREPGRHLIKAGKLVLRTAQKNPNMEQLHRVCGRHGWVIYYLEEQERKGIPVYQKDIEDRFTISRSNVSRMVKSMENNGIIARSVDKSDSRCKQLRLTPEGRMMLAQAAGEQDRLEERILRGFSQTEIDLLLAYLQRIIENLSEGGDR